MVLNSRKNPFNPYISTILVDTGSYVMFMNHDLAVFKILKYDIHNEQGFCTSKSKGPAPIPMVNRTVPVPYIYNNQFSEWGAPVVPKVLFVTIDRS